MGKASSKKVARAASTGGGRTSRGHLPLGWWSAMGLVVVLGTAGIWTSRAQRQDKLNPSGGVAPRVNKDHWHAAIGIYVCDKFEPNIPNNNKDPYGIHTHGDGIVHIHPFVRSASGNNATLSVFAKTMDLTWNATTLQVPGGKKYVDGDKCGDKKGEVQFYVNGTRRSGSPATYKMKDRDMLVLAFVAPGIDVPKIPPSAPNLDKLEDVPSTTTTAPPGTPGESTSTTAPGTPPESTATTAAPGGAASSSTTATTAAP